MRSAIVLPNGDILVRVFENRTTVVVGVQVIWG